MRRRLQTLGIFGFGAVSALAVMFAVRARAAGIPEAEVLTYTGYLEDGNGAPLTGTRSIAVRFWESNDPEDGLNAVCAEEDS
jgi:hypothetical protein